MPRRSLLLCHPHVSMFTVYFFAKVNLILIQGQAISKLTLKDSEMGDKNDKNSKRKSEFKSGKVKEDFIQRELYTKGISKTTNNDVIPITMGAPPAPGRSVWEDEQDTACETFFKMICPCFCCIYSYKKNKRMQKHITPKSSASNS
eukprot:NODE_123_length_17687_cov_0.732261.p13 type:complete len:146 gc:universal NODE_123_length_17687_cov_0.732261:15309-14872(-)